MATAPSVFQGLTPTFTGTGLSPLQLALASYMAQGTPLAFGPNQDFLQAMQVFSSSAPLSPLDVDPKTGLPRTPDISTNLVGFEYVVKGDDVYLFRRASDCGPDENRTELVLIGKRTEIATGTWTYYGPRIVSGSVAYGSGGNDGIGGFDSGPIDNFGDGYTQVVQAYSGITSQMVDFAGYIGGPGSPNTGAGTGQGGGPIGDIGAYSEAGPGPGG